MFACGGGGDGGLQALLAGRLPPALLCSAQAFLCGSLQSPGFSVALRAYTFYEELACAQYRTVCQPQFGHGCFVCDESNRRCAWW